MTFGPRASSNVGVCRHLAGLANPLEVASRSREIQGRSPVRLRSAPSEYRSADVHPHVAVNLRGEADVRGVVAPHKERGQDIESYSMVLRKPGRYPPRRVTGTERSAEWEEGSNTAC